MSEAHAIHAALTAPTLCAAFLQVAETSADRIALRDYGGEHTVTYAQWRRWAAAVAGGLRALGVEHGDRVALLLSTRLEFHIVDMGALLIGAVPFSLYNTAPVEQLLQPIDNAGPDVLITERSMADKGREIVQRRPDLGRLIVVDGGEQGELSLEDLEALCPPDFDVTESAAHVRPGDLCTLVYTSGTTGAPKGVQYRHSAWMATMNAIHSRMPVSPRGRVISYLPMAHIAERMFGHYAGFVFGYEITSLGDPARLAEALRAVRPTRFFGVPRIYEKLLAAIHAAITGDGERDADMLAAIERGVRRVRAEQAGEPVPADLRAAQAEHDRLFEPLRALVGLESAEWLGVAGAPSSKEMLEELHAIGLRVNEAYGMSETIIIASAPPNDIRLGSAGPALDTIETKLGEDNELLVRGTTVTPGYFGDPVRTREAIDDDGWMHTGDIVEIEADGYMTIVGRKKDIIINSAGKNMSPAAIEQAVKGGVPLLSQVVCIGDGRPYNVALIVIDPDVLRRVADEHGLTGASFAELAHDERVLDAVDRAVAAGNERLSRVEQIKRYAVLDHGWGLAGDELTPTGKLKRRAVEGKYAEIIAELYAPAPVG